MDFIGDPDGYFRGFGKLAVYGLNVASQRSSLTSKNSAILDKFATSARRQWIQHVVGRLEHFSRDIRAPIPALVEGAVLNLIEQVHAEDPLDERTPAGALMRLVKIMNAAGTPQKIDRTTVTVGTASPVAPTSSTGNGKLFHTAKTPDGVDWPYQWTEDIVFKCILDAQGVLARRDREQFQVRGQAEGPFDTELGIVDRFHPSWPMGSGTRGAYGSNDIVVCDPSFDARAGEPGSNAAYNTNFELWSGSLPRGWTQVVGSAGTDFGFTSTCARGSFGLRFMGDGSTLTKIAQPFNSATGSNGALLPYWPHAVWIMASDDGTTPTDGIARIRVVDGSDSTLDSGAATFNVDLTTVGTGFVVSGKVFNTPLALPSTTKLIMELTTALESGREAFFDQGGVAPLIPLGPPGPGMPYGSPPYVLIVPGLTPFVIDDNFTVSYTNNNEGAFAREVARFFFADKLGIALPSADGGAETIDDALIA